MPITRAGSGRVCCSRSSAASAPCTGEISVEDYGALVNEALSFLTGESDEVKRGCTR